MQKDLMHGTKRRSAQGHTPYRTSSWGTKVHTPNAFLGVIVKSWRSSQHCGAVPRTRRCFWAEGLAATTQSWLWRLPQWLDLHPPVLLH